MQIVNVNRCDSNLLLGRRGENMVRQLVFDVTGWERLYGPGVVVALNQRVEDTTPYPVAITQTGGKAYWTVSNVDTAQAGKYGKFELRYYIGDRLAKSHTWKTVVEKPLDVPDYDPEDPGTTWGERILSAAVRAEQEADRAKREADAAAESADHAEQQAASGGYMATDIIDGVLWFYRTANIEADLELEEGDLMLLWPIAQEQTATSSENY